MVLDKLALSADFFMLAGALIQVAGKFWVRHIVHAKNFRMPAGGTGVDVHTTRDNLDILGFLSIGVGSVYFVLNDAGLSSSSDLLLTLCGVQSVILVVLGFESVSVLSENSVEVLRIPVWPVHTIPFIGALLASMLMSLMIPVGIAYGTLEWSTTLPLLTVSIVSTLFIWRSLDFVTVRPLPNR